MSRPALAALLMSAILLSACSSLLRNSSGETLPRDRLKVSAASTPLAHAVQRVGSNSVEVTNLTRPGTDPHQITLRPADIDALADADLVVYLKGFQPAVDAAVQDIDPRKAIDVSAFINLRSPDPGAARAGSTDPHFWLDPTIYAKTIATLGTRLGEVDADNAAAYNKNAGTFVSELTEVDLNYKSALAKCASRDLVTGHTAFAYLAARYRLTHVGITDSTPSAMPTDTQLTEVAKRVRAHAIPTLYSEGPTDAAAVQALARQTGAQVATLETFEQPPATVSESYIEVMKANLAVLARGQGCR